MITSNPFVQPRLFYPLMLVEMWLRFTYYGTHVLLASYIAKQLNLDSHTTLYFIGTFVILAHGLSFVGGYIADNILNTRNTMLIGITLTIIGYGLFGLHYVCYFYIALGFITVGHAFFQANSLVLFARIYANDDHRLDGAFTLHYVIRHIGILVMPFLIPKLITFTSWQTIIFLLALSTSIAFLQLGIVWNQLKEIDVANIKTTTTLYKSNLVLAILLGLIVIVVFALQNNTVLYITFILVAISVITILLKHYAKLIQVEREKLLVALVLLISVGFYYIIFWKLHESLSSFSIHHVRRSILSLDIGSLSYVSINAIFIIILAPFLAWLYNHFAIQQKDWSYPSKFTVGLFACAIGFFILALSTPFADKQGFVAAPWLLSSYFFLTLADILIIALSGAMLARLVPAKMFGFMMGMHFLMLSVAVVISRDVLTPTAISVQLAEESLLSLTNYSSLFAKIGFIVLVFSLVMLLLLPKLKAMINFSIVPKITQTLRRQVSTRFSSYTYTLLIVLAGFILTIQYISVRYYYYEKNNFIIMTTYKSLQKSLEYGNRKNITEQIVLLYETNLFKKIAILDENKKIIQQLPDGSQSNKDTRFIPHAFFHFSGEEGARQENLTYKNITTQNGELLGYYAYQNNFGQLSMAYIAWSIIFLLLLFALYKLTVVMLRRKLNTDLAQFSLFVNELEKLAKNVHKLGTQEQPAVMSPESSEEQQKINEIMTLLITEIQASQEKIKEITHISEKQKLKAKLSEVALQVAHDIRSPLTALEMVTKELKDIPENSRILVRNASTRIRDIANNLLAQYSHKKDASQAQTSTLELLYSLLESVIAEKKVQYKDKTVNINLTLSKEAYSFFVKVQVVDFKRTMSNLINNAVEATNYSGTVEINVHEKNNKVNIAIIDSGCGIPEEELTKVIKEGYTKGKVGGAGMGLSGAVAHIIEWQGTYHIESTVDVGTKFIIELPIAVTPSWFVEQIQIVKGVQIVILDDDQSVHNVWDTRFQEKPQLGITPIHFYTSKELINYLERNSTENHLFLIDYELIGDEMHGVDVITQLNLANQAYLVTSRFDDNNLKQTCEQHGIKLIPKSYSVHIPITKLHSKVDLVFIDDNQTLRKAWLFKAKVVGKNIDVFQNADEFIRHLNNYPVDTPIYIDSNLGNGIKGEDVAKDIYDKGYRNLYLATGYDKSSFEDMYWLKEIVSKNVPF